MINRLLSHRITRAILLNRVSGLLGEYLERAKSENDHRSYRERYDVAPSFKFNGPRVTLYGRGDIRLGANSYIGRYSRIQSKEGKSVRVGENCALSHFLFIYTENRQADQDMSVARNVLSELETSEGDVEIGDHCWIVAFTFVTEGVTIGSNTVVGALSVVTRDLPPHSIAVGMPARVVQFKSYLSDAERAELASSYSDVLSSDLRTVFETE